MSSPFFFLPLSSSKGGKLRSAIELVRSDSLSQGEHGDRICAIGDRNSHATSSKGAQLRWSTLEAERLLGLTDLGALSSYDRLLRAARVLGLLLPRLRKVHSAACLLEDTFHWRVLCKREIGINPNGDQNIISAERPVSVFTHD